MVSVKEKTTNEKGDKMKKSCIYLVFLLAAVFFFTSSSTGQMQRKRATALKRVPKSHRIVFEKAPKRSLATINKARLSEHKGVARPAPLSVQKRTGLIREFRMAAGMTAADMALVMPSPPIQVVLTPDAPIKNRCDFSVWKGSHYPSGKGAVETKACPYAVGHASRSGKFFLNFWTRPNKSYFLDISVSPAGQWYLAGGVNGMLIPEDGHLTVGFKANSASTEIEFYKTSGNNFFFYRAELTQID